MAKLVDAQDFGKQIFISKIIDINSRVVDAQMETFDVEAG